MLNFTAGPMNLVSACQTAEIRLVLTSRAFVEKAELGARGRGDRPGRQASSGSRTSAQAPPATTSSSPRSTAGRSFASRDPDDPAAVLFTSGTEGAPKGVALSHANILANVAQVDARYDLRLSDIFFNPLPMFHAFGLTPARLSGS